ncbi:MAG: hypothetical protein ACLGH4_03530 [Actinomycetes bacterium]
MRKSWVSAAVVATVAGLLSSACGAEVEVSVDVPFYDPPGQEVPLPDAPGQGLDRSEPRTVAGWPVALDGSLVRVVLTDGPGAQRMVSLTADGRVVSAADTSVYLSRRDLTTWRLTKAQLATALGALDAAGVRTAEPGSFGEDAGAPSASVFFEPGRVAGGTDPRLVETVRAVVEPPARGVRPWAPAAIGFLAGPPDRTGRSPLGPSNRFRRWPLGRGVEELAFGEMDDAYGEPRLALCLRGRQAATVWRRLFTGENTAYLRVDDGRRWELNASVVLPGYVLYGSPCHGATVGE